MKRPLAKREKKSESDFACNVQFVNKLPELPFEPKFLKCPLEENRYVKYKETQLERDYKYELLSGVDVGVTLDLIDLSAFSAAERVAVLHPTDQQLVSGTTKMKAPSVLPFLHKFNYLNNEIVTRAVQPTTPSQVVTQQPEEDREKIISDIKASFEISKTMPTHPTNPNLTPVEMLPLFPDEDLWGNEYTEAVFDTDPIQDGENTTESSMKRQGAVIKSVRVGPETMLAYLVPRGKKRKRDEEDELLGMDIDFDDEDENPTEQEFEWIREYKFRTTNAGTGESLPYVFVFRDDGTVTYSEIKTKVVMQKVTKEGEFSKPSHVLVRQLDDLSDAAKKQREVARQVLKDESSQTLY